MASYSRDQADLGSRSPARGGDARKKKGLDTACQGQLLASRNRRFKSSTLGKLVGRALSRARGGPRSPQARAPDFFRPRYTPLAAEKHAHGLIDVAPIRRPARPVLRSPARSMQDDHQRPERQVKAFMATSRTPARHLGKHDPWAGQIARCRPRHIRLPDHENGRIIGWPRKGRGERKTANDHRDGPAAEHECKSTGSGGEVVLGRGVRFRAVHGPNQREGMERKGSGPIFICRSWRSHLEARLWT